MKVIRANTFDNHVLHTVFVKLTELAKIPFSEIDGIEMEIRPSESRTRPVRKGSQIERKSFYARFSADMENRWDWTGRAKVLERLFEASGIIRANSENPGLHGSEMYSPNLDAYLFRKAGEGVKNVQGSGG